MGINLIHKRADEGIWNMPIYGAGADVAQGAFMKKGTTPGTNNGALIQATGNNAAADCIGRLAAKLTYATDTETLVAGTTYATKPILLNSRFRVHRVEISQASADLITCTQAVNSTTMTVTSLEDDIDAAFLYVVSGVGLGQINYLTAAAAGSCTLKAAFGTSLDTTSKFIKILPKIHTFGSLTTDGTKLSSQAAVGSWNIVVIDTYIERNGRLVTLNPVLHSALTNLNGLRSLKFWADIAVRDSIPNSID